MAALEVFGAASELVPIEDVALSPPREPPPLELGFPIELYGMLLATIGGRRLGAPFDCNCCYKIAVLLPLALLLP